MIDEEGVGETSGQRPDRIFEKRLRFPKEGPAEEAVLPRTVRITFKSAVSPQATLADVRSGPDVFADALVPRPERAGPGIPFQKHDCVDGAAGLPLWADRVGAMVIPLRMPNVNDPPGIQQSPGAQRFCRSRTPARHRSIYIPFIATLKPAFKLDRP